MFLMHVYINTDAVFSSDVDFSNPNWSLLHISLLTFL